MTGSEAGCGGGPDDRRRLRTRARVAAALACVLAFACADEPTGPPASFSVSVAAPPASSFTVGDTLRLEAEIRDHRGGALRGAVVAWSSSDARVVSVGPGGVVTAVSPGTATITAASGGALGTVQLSVADPEIAVLSWLYGYTGGSRWTNNDNWWSDEDLDDWYGVDVDSAGRIVGLDLQDNNLTGHIPAALGDLSDLRYLNLSGNLLTGEIPPELGGLEQLHDLLLHRNGLTGSIPAELGNLHSLERLRLNFNQLTGSIPSELGDLESLRAMWAYANELTGPIPSELGDLESLRTLNLSGNDLTGPIPSELGDLESLLNLVLADNDLTGSIPAALGGLDSLGVLQLSHNDLTGSIPAALGGLEDLKTLWLSHNRLTGNVPSELGGLSALAWLLLGDNDLSGPLPLALKELPLFVFGYADTELCVPVNTSFRAWLESIPEHEGTGVDCGGSPAGDRAVLEALYDSTTGPNWTDDANWKSDRPLNDWYRVTATAADAVTGVRLHGNNLVGVLPPELGDLALLEDLQLYDNSLSGAIPSELGNLESLEWLHLQDNGLTGSIPPQLANLESLELLNLGNNKLTGSIPRELGNLESLEYLYLQHNGLTGLGLTGSIPLELGNLESLTDLRFQDNGLTGSIPRELGDLESLRQLYLYDNELSGAIPVEFARLESLEDLSVRGNDLCVPRSDAGFMAWLEGLDYHDTDGLPSCPSTAGDRAILEIFYNSTGGDDWTTNTNWLTDAPLNDWYGVTAYTEDEVSKLSLLNNELTGSIPPKLGDLESLTYLDLYRNKLTGSIPPELGNLESLTRLLLHNNELTGSIPPELGDLGSLEWLGLTSNGLTGSIPPELGDLESLTYLHLHNNELADSIPPELGDLESLKELFLEDNGLTGPIPPELGDLESLEWLSLHSNKLTGSIPSALGRLSSLTRLHINDNLVKGPLPLELSEVPLQTFHYYNTDLCVPANDALRQWLDGIGDHRGTGVDCDSGNRPPTTVASVTLPTLQAGDVVIVNVAFVFHDPDGDALTYTAASSDTAVATVSVSDSIVTVTAVAAGTADVTVTATDPDGLSVSSSMSVTVTGGSGGFRDNFDSSASLTDWTIDNADADIASGVLRLTNRVEEILGLAERRGPPSLTGWTIAARMGRVAGEASPGVISFTGHDRFAAISFELATRDSTNYEVALFDEEADRWVSVTNMSGHSEAVMEDAAAFTDVTLGSEGDDFVAYADNDSRDEPAELFRFDMDNTSLDGVALREFLYDLTGLWLINSGPVGLTSLHDWVEVTGTASGAAAVAAAAVGSGIDPAWTADVSVANRVRVEGADRGREPR